MTKNLYSPSMLKKFLSCKYIIFNEVNEKKLGLKRREIGLSDALRMEKGNLHEERYFQELKRKHKKVIDLKELDITREEKFSKTLEYIKEGYDVIHGGYLKYQEWIGEFDFLIKATNQNSKLGNYNYEVADTKNSIRPKVDHVAQIAMYAYMLEPAQGVLSKNFYIILRDDNVEVVPLKYVNEFFKYNKDRYEKFLKNELDTVKPEKCSHCPICDWLDVCEKKWKDDDHLNQVGGINKNYIKKLVNVKIDTATKLANLDDDKKIEDIKPHISKRLITQAKLQKEYERTGISVHKIYEENINNKKGFNLLPRPSESDIFFDFESVEDHVYLGGLEYLFGIYYKENKKEVFKPLWGHNRNEEKKNLINFFIFLKEHFEKYPQAKIYHYGSYEVTALNKLTSRHNINNDLMAHYLIEKKFVNLLNVIRQGVQISENSYSIKNIEKIYGFKRKGDVKKASISSDYYAKWTETNDQKLLDEIESYNYEDCVSTLKLLDWLLKIKPKNTEWLVPEKENVEDREFETNLKNANELLKNLQTKDAELKQVMLDILGFFRREQKSEWREHYERLEKTNEELIDDLECIGDMTLVGEPEKKVKSFIYTYTYENQEHKLRQGKKVTVLNHFIEGKTITSTIEDLDHVNRIIKLKRGVSSGSLGSNISIGPSSPTGILDLEKCTYKFIGDLVNGTNKFKAIIEILKKEIPDIKGIKHGDKILKTDNFENELPKILLNLNQSYLYIQGPPGSGKTYQAGNAIIELIKNKKKVGITGNSHKVIHNLIKRVEEFAVEKNVKFKGLKAGRKDDPETVYESDFFETSSTKTKFTNAVDIEDNEYFLFAGTKFHFSSIDYDQKLDYLFIDEAGQLSISDLVAIGIVSKNIVILGDQLQLSQPIKGAHPGKSGLSILDYLLENIDTIPDTKGVFLNKTYRLHPLINNFASENFYESRLICREENKNRKIHFNKDCMIQSEGIHYIPMHHKDNTQICTEEGEVVKKLFKQIIGLDFTDIDDKKRKLTIKDILVISPYNAQVNYLLSILEKGARVGTIDRFQGQEAVVNIISFTSSDTDSITRNKEFFFSRNRLNVAITRAQCASILLLNPNLVDFYPTTIDQVKLLNNFYKIIGFRS